MTMMYQGHREVLILPKYIHHQTKNHQKVKFASYHIYRNKVQRACGNHIRSIYGSQIHRMFHQEKDGNIEHICK